MDNKKYVSAFVALATLATQSAQAAYLDASSVMGDVGSASQYLEDSEDSSSASSEDTTDNGDAVVTLGEVKKGSYDVNGDLTVEGVLYVFGNLDVNGSLVIGKNAKLRVTGLLTVNGDIENKGGNVYAAKRDVNGGVSGNARKIDSLLAELDPLISGQITGEEREGILQDILDSKGIVRLSRLEDFLDSLKDSIEESDVAAYEKIKKRLLAALEKKIKAQGGLKDAQLDAFKTKLDSMATEKLEVFVSRIEKLQKATKKKRFAFQLAQLKELAEEVIESREASIDEPVVEVPAPTTGSTSGTSTGSASSTGSTSTSSGTTSGSSSTASGSTSTTSTGSTATGTTVQQ